MRHPPWKKTANGYAGDIAIPVSFFDAGQFSKGYEIGMSFEVQKVFPPAKPAEEEHLKRIILSSKKDHLFRVTAGNPSSFPRLVLADTP
jgi:hypothetical protein